MPIDYQYLNIVIYNGTNQDVLCQYSDTRSQNVLEKANDFEMSVVRFSVPTQRMPIFIFPLDEENIANNEYIIGWQVNGGALFTQPLTLANYAANFYLLNNFPINDVRRQYVYSMLDWVDFINFNIAAVGTTGGGFPGGEIPILIYDNPTGKLQWLMPATFATGNDYIYMNSALYNTFFSGFPAIYDQGTNSYLLYSRQRANNEVLANTYPPITWATWSQYDENNSIVSWNTIRRIVILSSQLQVNNESISILNNNQPVNASILSDYEIPFNTNQAPNKAYAFYQPAIFRYASMITDSPVKKIDLYVFFENSTDQTLYPLYISPAQDAYIKILFRRRVNPALQIPTQLVDEIEGKGKFIKQTHIDEKSYKSKKPGKFI